TEPLTHTQWLEEIASIPKPYPPALCHKDGFLNPKALLPQIFARLAPNAIVVADVGQNQIWAANAYNLAQGRFLTSGGLGTMGYSLPATMGAKAAAPKRQVVCICGDGSFQMMLNELATARQNDLDIKIIVMRND